MTEWDTFLSAVVRPTVYAEPVTEFHNRLASDMVARIRARTTLPPAPRVFDLGCGPGPALATMHEAGWRVQGLAASAEDVATFRAAGGHADLGEMHTSPIPPADLYWCRHVLEHSPAPLFVLWRLRQAAPDGAWLYVEVPCPDTPAAHQTNPNHFGVLTPSGWREAVTRAGWRLTWEQPIGLSDGPRWDRYHALLATTTERTPNA